jgi:hypothetical protein
VLCHTPVTKDGERDSQKNERRKEIGIIIKPLWGILNHFKNGVKRMI